MIKGVTLTPLQVMHNPKGNIFQALKSSEDTFQRFGEAYFSTIHQLTIKGWKKHTVMQLNLIVISGEVQFVLYDDRADSLTNGQFYTVNLSPSKHYARLTIEPHIWVAFKGIQEHNIILNIASIEHDANEAMVEPIDFIAYDW
jgi:dTDP-4-dehydrorhamnose 3,5-epimerase